MDDPLTQQGTDGQPAPDGQRLAKAFRLAAYITELDGTTIELAVGHVAHELEQRLRGHCFAYITAWNPGGVTRGDAENAAADLELCRLIDSHRLVRVPMGSSAPDGEWWEPGWLVLDVSRVTLDEWAHHFGQSGTLWWQRGQPVHLRMYVPNPQLGSDIYTDWIE